ncbi:unnamed protein product [Brachionus calyciflorus]|uniref:Reverse transcriptase domain-containing protein n=1 Tax=Brachionus calyciflorus TaxID=104777 RepID=A0A814L0M9_9BILA|nr:unnamed protein product [Brachionus calyciflorus]
MINSKIVPFHFNLSMIKPLIKDKNGALDELTNLRPVYISDSLANLYESILLEFLKNEYTENENQLGLKKSSSCQHAIFTLKYIIRKCKKKGKRLYVSAIDASKAFDKVNREILWSIMIDLKINPALIHAIMSYYDESEMLVVNENEFSDIFETQTNIMIFNRSFKRTVRSKREDGWQEPIMFDGEVIKEVSNMKYLGYELDTKNNNKMHLDKRKKLEMNAAMSLKTVGIWNQYSSPYLKSHNFKAFIRPILMYGMETINLNKTEINDLRIKKEI